MSAIIIHLYTIMAASIIDDMKAVLKNLEKLLMISKFWFFLCNVYLFLTFSHTFLKVKASPVGGEVVAKWRHWGGQKEWEEGSKRWREHGRGGEVQGRGRLSIPALQELKGRESPREDLQTHCYVCTRTHTENPHRLTPTHTQTRQTKRHTQRQTWIWMQHRTKKLNTDGDTQ